MLNDAIMNTTPPESGPFQAFFLTLNSTLPSHLGQALSTARHLSVSDFAKRNVHKDTEWDSTSAGGTVFLPKMTGFCALRILTLQKWLWRTRTPCYSGSNPSIGGSLGILRVAYFCGKKIRSFLPEMCVLRFWCNMNGKKNDQCQMVIVAGCLRWKNNDGKKENVQYIIDIYVCYVYYSRQSPFQKRCISTKGHPTSPSPEKGPMVIVGYQKRTEKKWYWYSSWIKFQHGVQDVKILWHQLEQDFVHQQIGKISKNWVWIQFPFGDPNFTLDWILQFEIFTWIIVSLALQINCCCVRTFPSNIWTRTENSSLSCCGRTVSE